jgi:tRNA (cytidine/uridine-2'-O-)-methyltransferase
MDYAGLVEVRRHVDWNAFVATAAGRIVLATTTGAVPLPAARFEPDDILLLGSEGAGVPAHVHDRADLRVRVPMRSGLRSLNVAVAGAMLLGEALRQTEGWPTA